MAFRYVALVRSWARDIQYGIHIWTISHTAFWGLWQTSRRRQVFRAQSLWHSISRYTCISQWILLSSPCMDECSCRGHTIRWSIVLQSEFYILQQTMSIKNWQFPAHSIDFESVDYSLRFLRFFYLFRETSGESFTPKIRITFFALVEAFLKCRLSRKNASRCSIFLFAGLVERLRIHVVLQTLECRSPRLALYLYLQRSIRDRNTWESFHPNVDGVFCISSFPRVHNRDSI